jgi:hypothetical protein
MLNGENPPGLLKLAEPEDAELDDTDTPITTITSRLLPVLYPVGLVTVILPPDVELVYQVILLPPLPAGPGGPVAP